LAGVTIFTKNGSMSWKLEIFAHEFICAKLFITHKQILGLSAYICVCVRDTYT